MRGKFGPKISGIPLLRGLFGLAVTEFLERNFQIIGTNNFSKLYQNAEKRDILVSTQRWGDREGVEEFLNSWILIG